MNARQDAKLGMIENILGLCKDNQATVDVLAAFANGVKAVETIATNIKAAALIQSGKATGSINKKEAKGKAAKLTLTVADGVSAYATSINDGDLRKAMSFNLSELEKMRDEDFPTTCTAVRLKANDLIADLADFGITPATLTALGTAIGFFTSKNTDPATIKAQKKVATANIKQYFKDADEVFDTILDKLVDQLVTTDAEFVKNYHALREIVDPASTHTSVKGTISNALTNAILIKAKFIIDGKEVFTNTKGQFVALVPVTGSYPAKAVAPGFLEKDIPGVNVVKGEVTKLDIKLTPQP